MTGGNGFSPRSDHHLSFRTGTRACRRGGPSSMRGQMHLLDTSICVEILRGRSPQLPQRFRSAMRSGVAASCITAAELFYGVATSPSPDRERANVSNLLGSLSILSFDSKAAEGFGVLRAYLERRGEVMGQFDLLIAAHALAED